MAATRGHHRSERTHPTRKRAKKGAGEGNKKREMLKPTLRAPLKFGPNCFGMNVFLDESVTEKLNETVFWMKLSVDETDLG